MQDRIQTDVYISLGSNIGDGVRNCVEAVRALGKVPDVVLVAKSSYYSTEPWGVKDQPVFTNCVARIETRLSPLRLLSYLKAIERKLGRPPEAADRRWAPRIIDLDIVFFGDVVLGDVELTLPHPRAVERGFVMIPLAEIAPDYAHPVTGCTMAEIANALGARERVELIQDVSL